ncbi:MAG: hypothetical protein OXR66_02590 [Candidatus Woesearchaeota archaeon]|nr:hypothetical protein [Candidatus Woesearchaeota archaeon]
MNDDLLFVLSVTITTLGIIAVAGVLKGLFRGKATLKKKLFFFPVFILGLLVFGGVTAFLQGFVYEYLQQNLATSVSGMIIIVLVAWILYDWVLWRRR